MTRDAMTQPATAEQAGRLAKLKGISVADAAARLEAARERQIALRRDDPFGCGYEPPIWYVVKAIMRNPEWSEYERAHIRKRLGEEWTAEVFAEKMRKRLGFEHPVTKVLIMGSNRSGKTDFSSKLIIQTLLEGGKKVCSGAQTHQTQKKNQMRRVWHYLPKELQEKNVATKKAKDIVENISYTEKNGFAGSRVTLGNRSELDFITYEMTTNSLEGVEYDLAHLDEEYGIGHYNLMTTRITSRSGMFLGTFTPLNGYTPSIAAFLNDKQVTRWHTAYLRPKDGGEKMPWKELNLTKGEYEELTTWRREGQTGDCRVPESRPEDCFEWLFDDGDGGNSAEDDGGRSFDKVPRICVCQGGQAAAVWFYGSDNPYGLPSELIITKMADENAEDKIYSSVYGMAKDLKGKLLKSFTEASVVRAEDVPKRLVRFQVIDPAPERNWCMAWFGYSPEQDTLYAYREWPGDYVIPGQGVPGPWVVPSDKNKGVNDGARGEAQDTFGFGYNHIKYEIARLEGWKSFEEWARQGNDPLRMPETWEDVEEWDSCDGAREVMAFRVLDSRAASQSKISGRTNNTLMEDLENYLSGLQVADGQKLVIGYARLNDKLATGKFKVVDTCRNIIDCMNLLTGKDGQKGAAKDFVDLCRYAVMTDIWNYRPEDAVEEGDKTGPQASRRDGLDVDRTKPLGEPYGRSRRVWW